MAHGADARILRDIQPEPIVREAGTLITPGTRRHQLPRDFRAEDGELRISAPRLSIDGRLHESTAGLQLAESGTIVWIYVPERGRFLLSLAPRAELGFRRAGEVWGSALTFTAGGETFALVSGTTIAGGVPFNLYVRHEPEWVPAYTHANLSAFTMGTEAVVELAN